jgi:hypothetical protein
VNVDKTRREAKEGMPFIDVFLKESVFLTRGRFFKQTLTVEQIVDGKERLVLFHYQLDETRLVCLEQVQRVGYFAHRSSCEDREK